MKKIFLFIAGLSLCLSATGQNVKIEQPTVKAGNSFVIVIDKETLNRDRAEVVAYRDALQEDGLATYILSGEWANPSQVRSELEKLYAQAHMEGIVLIGDIPVAMVRNAQHMTTAFKMNEETFPMDESSVGSDRFYDDLHLSFDFIEQDSVYTDHFYYNLRNDSPQKLNPTYYSGRIKYPAELGGDKYEAIATFLRKVVEAKKNPQTLDNMVTFAGDGYNSDCLLAWQDESIAIDENFPLVGKDSRSLKQLNFRMDTFMKYRLFDELQRIDVDVMFFNEHGSIDKQHISGQPNPDSFADYVEQYKYGYGWVYSALSSMSRKQDVAVAKEELKKEFHLTDAFFEDYFNEEAIKAYDEKSDKISEEMIISLEDLKGFNPQPRFVMFNACYNGSFHRPGNIAGYYIFGNGKTVATQGNTINVLQDRWTYEMVGLLSHGVRVGEYNRMIATLEGHIVGDPTFHFNSISGDDLRADLAAKPNDKALWEKYLQEPHAPVQAVALRKLADMGAIGSKEVLAKMRESEFATVRMECLKLLTRWGGKDFVEGIKLGMYDNYELLRRNAATWSGKCGDPELLPAMLDIYVNYPESQRVNYAISISLPLFDTDRVIETLNGIKDSLTYLDTDKVMAETLEAISSVAELRESNIETIFDKSASSNARMMAIRTVRNSVYHCYIDKFLEMIADESDDAHSRMLLAEALGWFVFSHDKAKIVDGCRKICADPNINADVKAEVEQTINRLK